MAESRTYPQGVTSWIDTEQPDPQAAAEFYRGLFGWTLTEAMPPGAPGSYLIATLDGQDVAAIAPTLDGAAAGGASWNTYVAVDDADAAARAVVAAGGTLSDEPQDAGPGGRWAGCADPAGAPFRLWQARRRLGAQLTNAPGAWNFSDLSLPDPVAVQPFYTAVFGWVFADLGAGAMIQVPGYGDHLAATVDPGIYERQAQAPAGFADVIGSVAAGEPGEAAHWHVIFTVADRDSSAAAAQKLGAVVLAASSTDWTLTARVRDPQGAEFTISQFTPPDGW